MSSDNLGWYLNQIGRYPLLTPKQEIILARQIKGDNKRVAERARRKLFTSNLRYVVNLSRRFQARVTSMDLLDLIQYGNMGLSLAVDKFDSERGYRFSTYARDWICQAIRRGIGCDEYLVRVPINRLEQILRVRRTTADLVSELGRNPTHQEIAAAADVPMAALQIAAVHGKQHYSLDAYQGSGDGDITPLDRLASPEQPDSIDPSFATDALNLLPERERLVLARYYGLGQEATTMTAIANDLGIGRERVRHIKDRALSRIRLYMNQRLSA